MKDILNPGKTPKESPASSVSHLSKQGYKRLYRFDLFKTMEIAERFSLCFIIRSGVSDTALRVK